MVTGGTCAAEGWDRPSRLFFPPLQRPSARWRPRRWARRSQRGPPARGRVGGGGGAPPGANTIANGVPPLTPARGFHRVAPTVSLSPLATAEAHGQFALIDHKPIASIRTARQVRECVSLQYVWAIYIIVQLSARLVSEFSLFSCPSNFFELSCRQDIPKVYITPLFSGRKGVSVEVQAIGLAFVPLPSILFS